MKEHPKFNRGAIRADCIFSTSWGVCAIINRT